MILGIAILIFLVFALYLWSYSRLKHAIKLLGDVNLSVQRELAMSDCKCKNKTPITADPYQKCEDPNEESFRMAYLSTSKRLSILSAEKIGIESELRIYRQASEDLLRNLTERNEALQNYCRNAFLAIPEHLRLEFTQNHGAPPVSLKGSKIS